MSGISDSWPEGWHRPDFGGKCGMSYVIRVIIPNLAVVLDSKVKIF